MKSSRILYFFLSLVFNLSCRTNSSTSASEPAEAVPEYDGSAENLEVLPDCSQDMTGSLFWVRESKTAYECARDGKWVARGHIDPDGSAVEN